MEEVVGKMNQAQIEVMELQSARWVFKFLLDVQYRDHWLMLLYRDEAMRQTRKLQAAINAEREKVDSLMR